MVTTNFAVPSNNDQGPELLRNISPHLDLAETLGADLIRVCMKKEDDIVAAQRASDQARERKIRLAHQSHFASLFETVDNSTRILKAIGRPNFGIIYEPANWLVTGQNYGRETLRKLQPYLFNVYVQNHRLTPDGKAALVTWNRGKVALDHIGIWEKGGVDYDEVAAGLRDVNYNGYVTIHQAFGDVMPVDEAVRRSREYLARILPVKA
jgi:sugar phosphate isomerase/epimerase